MGGHLIWEKFAKERGEFVVSSLPLPRESVRDVIFLPREPLTIALDVRAHEYFCVFSCRVDSRRRLDRVDARFAEIRFSHPAFGRRAVGHRKCAISPAEAAVDDVDPWCDHRRQKF